MPQVAAKLILKLSAPDALATRAIACTCEDSHLAASTPDPVLHNLPCEGTAVHCCVMRLLELQESLSDIQQVSWLR